MIKDRMITHPVGENRHSCVICARGSKRYQFIFLSISERNFGNMRITIACVRANLHAKNNLRKRTTLFRYLLCSQNFDSLLPCEFKLSAFKIRLLLNAIIAVCSIYLGNAFGVKRFYFRTPYEFQLYFL